MAIPKNPNMHETKKCYSSIEETVKKLCESIEENNKSMGMFINSEVEKITLIRDLIETDCIVTDDRRRGLREINKLISSLTMHEWILIKKIEAVNDLMNHLEE